MADNEEITIVKTDAGLTVQPGRSPNARMEWSTAGLTIYLKGAFPTRVYLQACHLAVSETIARNIAAVSLKRIPKWLKNEKL